MIFIKLDISGCWKKVVPGVHLISRGHTEGSAHRSIAALCTPTTTFALWAPGTLLPQRTNSMMALTGKPLNPGIQTSVFAWKCPERSSSLRWAQGSQPQLWLLHQLWLDPELAHTGLVYLFGMSAASLCKACYNYVNYNGKALFPPKGWIYIRVFTHIVFLVQEHVPTATFCCSTAPQQNQN